jgi:hypothetical protein
MPMLIPHALRTVHLNHLPKIVSCAYYQFIFVMHQRQVYLPWQAKMVYFEIAAGLMGNPETEFGMQK